MNLTEWAKENSTVLAAVALAYIGYVEVTDATYPSVPGGSDVAVLGGVAVAVVGYIAAGKIYDLLPDEDGIYLVAFEANDEAGGSVWELSEDQFEDMEVFGGTLFQWPVSKQVYEVRHYRPSENVAVANWRESVAASQLAGHTKVLDAMAAIDELRLEFEPEAERYRHTKRRLRAVARQLDRRRDRDQQKILDPHMTPDFGEDGDGATVTDVLSDTMPDHLLPESMEAGDQTDGQDSGEFAGFEILDNSEALEPDPVDREVMANDD